MPAASMTGTGPDPHGSGPVADRWLVTQDEIVDTTSHDRWTPVRVTAHLAEPIAGLAEQPLLLDGPVSWGAHLAATRDGLRLPPLTSEWAVDYRLPLATWTRPLPDGARVDPRLLSRGLVWGWAGSRAHPATGRATAVELRRRPPVQEMARFSRDRRHHLGLGPHKARDTIVAAVDTRQVVWWALADPDQLTRLLDEVTHLGRHTRHGHGRVLHWEVTEDPEATSSWQQRPLPAVGGMVQGVRAPHWHPSRRLPCHG